MNPPTRNELVEKLDALSSISIALLLSNNSVSDIRAMYNEAWSKDQYMTVAVTALCLTLIAEGKSK